MNFHCNIEANEVPSFIISLATFVIFSIFKKNVISKRKFSIFKKIFFTYLLTFIDDFRLNNDESKSFEVLAFVT